MRIWLLSLLVGVAVAKTVAGDNTKDDKVKLAVYYESLCPDSKKFITRQLAPVWRNLRGVIKVKLVPYGKATHEQKNGKWEFTCQHGPDECYGNKVQACLLKDKKLVDNDKVELVICLMNQTNPDKSLGFCLTKMGKADKLQTLQTCADSDQGSNLLASYGDKTDLVQKPLSFVPTNVINEKFDDSYQNEAMEDLKGLICRNLVTKPASCTSN